MSPQIPEFCEHFGQTGTFQRNSMGEVHQECGPEGGDEVAQILPDTQPVFQ